MKQSRLDDIREGCAEIFVKFTNGWLDSKLRGTGKENALFYDSLRVSYLYGILSEVYLDGTTLYVGDTVVEDKEVETVFDKIWHYNGIYAIDLADYLTNTDTDGTIIPDDGDGDVVVPGVTPVTDHYRSGTQVAVVGTNVIGFSSPLPSADYTIQVYVIGETGYQQTNLVVSTVTANGFVVTDVLEAGVLTYFCVIEL